MVWRTASSAARRSAGSPARYSATVVASDCMGLTPLYGAHTIVLRVVLELAEAERSPSAAGCRRQSARAALSSGRTSRRWGWRRTAPGLDRPFLGGLLLICAAQLHPIAGRLQHGVEIVHAAGIVVEGRRADGADQDDFPSFSSVCIVYADVPGGVISCQGLSLERFGRVVILLSFTSLVGAAGRGEVNLIGRSRAVLAARVTQPGHRNVDSCTMSAASILVPSSNTIVPVVCASLISVRS